MESPVNPGRFTPRLQYKHGAYYYVRRVGAKVRWKRLSANHGEALKLWAELEAPETHCRDVGQALDVFLRDKVPAMAHATQREYRRYSRRLRNVFGDVRLDDVRPSDVAWYLDTREAKIEANREITLLSSVFQLAIRRGWCHANPCRDVRRNPEKPRKRHVTDTELTTLRSACDDQMGAIVDLVLLTALRKIDVLRIRLADLKTDGLEIEMSKTGRRLLFEWTPSLRDVVDTARALPRRVGSMYLFANRVGQPYTTSGFDSNWKRLMRREGLTFTFHDLRARALTDANRLGGRDYAQVLAGHESGDTTERYLRNREFQRVKPLK